MLLHHITLLTGHIATHRIDTLDPLAVEACRDLLPSGGPVPSFPAFRVEIAGEVFTVWRGQEPVVTCAVGRGKTDAWTAVLDLQKRFSRPTQDPRAPSAAWLSTALLPGIANLTRDDIMWLGDFERCLAAAMLTDAEPKTPPRPAV